MSRPQVSDEFVSQLKVLARETGLRLLLVWHQNASRYAVVECTLNNRPPRTLIIIQDKNGNYEHPSGQHIMEMRTKIDFQTMKKFLGQEDKFWQHRERLKKEAAEKKDRDHRTFLHEKTKDDHNQIVRYARQATGEVVKNGLHTVSVDMKNLKP